ncbi:hypothetical protein BDFB_014260 [Asbolus verrucosus]|uniref:Uncharacterized protein n=1 Tax=Asbolus verrucosus TaxID=1661398 RepID=A0A482VNS9_ASBVE|nr:hypothetical protein BDFB_014260 [Asbolus verrucosus]
MPGETNKSRGGGVLDTIKKDIPSYQFNIDVNKREELWIHVILNEIKIILGVVYFPPNSNLDIYIQHVNLVNNLVSHHSNSLICIIGVHNLPKLVRKSSVECNNFIPFNISSMAEEYLCDNFAFNGLLQFNDIGNDYNVILDLVFCNDKTITYKSVPLISEDIYHPALNVKICDINLRLKKKYY